MTFSQSKKKLPTHSQKVKAQKELQLDLDFDGDGLTEREERKYGLNPLSPDSDGDGLYDSHSSSQLSEVHLGSEGWGDKGMGRPGERLLVANSPCPLVPLSPCPKTEFFVLHPSENRYQEIGLRSNPRSYSFKVPPSVEGGSEKERLRAAYLCRVQAILKASNLSYAALYNQIAGDDWLGRSLDERVMAAELDSGNSNEKAKCLIAQSPYVQWQLSEGQWDRDSAIHYAWELTAQFQPHRKQQEQLSE